MAALAPNIVTRLPGDRFRHARGAWHIDLPIGRLGSWTAFYRRLAKAQPRFYTEAVEALEAFGREISA